jgi:uncharacterized membrane protein
MKAASLLHRTFQTGITLKGIDGVLETIGGLLLWFISPSRLNEIVRGLLQHELLRNPHDFSASHFAYLAQKLSTADPWFASVFLLSHGLSKVLIVIAMWRNKLWAYPLGIFVFGVFTAYEAYRYTHTHSYTLGMITILDAGVVVLTFWEYRRQKRERSAVAAEGRL